MTAAVYIAGPIGKGPQVHHNVLAAIDAAHEVREMGLLPYVPHLSWYWQIVHPRAYEDWMAQDFEWIKRCDALLRLPGMSPGADREVAFAFDRGIPVFTDLEHLREWAARPENQ